MPDEIDYTSDNFWEQYAEYVDECFNRHDCAVGDIYGDESPMYLLDLGCGKCQEGKRLFKPARYHGVDSEALEADQIGDYRTAQLPFEKFDMFCSIFSTEITATGKDNMEFYESIFEQYPTIECGLVSGLFYLGRETEVMINVVENVDTYQSIDYSLSLVYEEKRLVIHGPSKLFGNEEMEVWKMFIRR